MVFQGTALPATRWFLPAMAAGTALVLGSLQVFGGNGGWRPALQWLAVSAAAGVGTAVLRCGTGAGERGRPLYFAALLSGLSGLTALGLPFDPGLIGGCAMVYGAPELSAVCAAAAALGLTGNLGWSVTAALLLPAVTARVVRSDLARALLGGALCCGVLWLGGVGTPAAFAAVGIGIPLRTVAAADRCAPGLRPRRGGGSWPRAAWGMRRRCSSCCRLSSRCRSEA